jgi:uncharacterized membrane protein (DUF4010 family)
MTTFELFQRLSVALAIGLLIGLERGWRARTEGEGERAAGLRTHALGGFLGGVWGAIAISSSAQGGMVALGLAFIVYSIAVVVFRFRETEHDGSFGMTTVVGGMLAFALGAYAVVGSIVVAAAGGVAVAGLLALKAILHDWVKRLSWEELRSALMLLAMTFVALPLLPDRTVDRWQAINPHEIWLLTILIAAISFAGYVAIRLLGARRGVVFGGIAGGIASSTAMTLTNARLALEHPEGRDSLIAGALIAGATMVLRVLVIVGVINSALLRPSFVLSLTVGGLVLALFGAYLLLRADRPGEQQEPIRLRNPFELSTVLQFAAVLTVVGVAAKLAAVLGDSGILAVAAISGIADVDAITLSMARLGGVDVGLGSASAAVALAVGVNTAAKAILGGIAGGPDVGKWLGLASGAALLAGASTYAILLWLAEGNPMGTLYTV